jgi:hypothetical protein
MAIGVRLGDGEQLSVPRRRSGGLSLPKRECRRHDTIEWIIARYLADAHSPYAGHQVGAGARLGGAGWR